MTKPKKRINSRAKGSEYERKIATVLGSWWGEKFHRTPASGGLHWKDDNRVAGDIVTPVQSKFPYTTECKKRNEWDLEQVLKGTGDVEKWWKQAVEDSERVQLKPILIFSKNFAPNYLMMWWDDFEPLLQKDTKLNYYKFQSTKENPRAICSLDAFIKAVPKEVVLKTYGL